LILRCLLKAQMRTLNAKALMSAMRQKR